MSEVDITSFYIQNFKGIISLHLDLEKTPKGAIFPIVGLNESGKTTILEAINYFTPYAPENIPLDKLFKEKFISDDIHELIPIGKRANFNSEIEIATNIRVDASDKEIISNYCKTELNYNLDKNFLKDKLSIRRVFEFKNSNYSKTTNYWNIKLKGKRTGERRKKILSSKGKDRKLWVNIVNFVETLLPSVLYFPTFLFEFPDKIFLQKTSKEDISNSFFRTIIQDILDSLGPGLTIKEHILDRAGSSNQSDKRNLRALLNEMALQVTQSIFGAWKDIINEDMGDKEIIITLDTDVGSKNKKAYYLRFSVFDGRLEYSISERSLGFRWFFCFLLFTHFRGYRINRKMDLILFDEPASNLHSSAQGQLLKCFDSTALQGYKIIYSTHSQYMINPKWLENTFIVKNLSQKFNENSLNDYSKKETNISIQRYREFVSQNPNETTYFQPILDHLCFQPCKLEYIPNVVMLEGKYDYYYLEYFIEKLFPEISNLNFLPGMGATNLGPIISLYQAWGKKYIIILDSDSVGLKRRKMYLTEYLLPEDKIYTLEDIDSNWNNYKFEKLFSSQAKTNLRDKYFPNRSKKLSKSELAKLIQEMLLVKEPWNYCDETSDNFKKIIEFSNDKLNK